LSLDAFGQARTGFLAIEGPLCCTAHQDGAATDYIYNYLESRDGAVWSVVCIGHSGRESACRVFHRGERAVLYSFRKSQRVKTGRFSSSKEIVGKVCGAESGCFAVQITHISGANGQTPQ